MPPICYGLGKIHVVESNWRNPMTRTRYIDDSALKSGSARFQKCRFAELEE
jgi:hypothetical protein